jgi:hypothetical protein
VSDVDFFGNTAGSDGGGGIHSYGTTTVSSSTFAGNSTSGGGGGIRQLYDSGTLTVRDSTFLDNSGGGGGGIHNYRGRVTVVNSTFSGNNASYGGGGIGNDGSSTLVVSNSTFSGNGASFGGGIGNFGTTTLKNTIVANSPTGSNCSGTITNGGGNLSYPDATCPGINADPMLGPLQNNGGPTETMELGTGSAALDAANDATCAAPPVNNVDQRGVTRPQGAHCDIGAFEWVCPSFVPPASVDVEDIVAMAARWGWTSSTPGWDPAYDLNLDDKIDIVDIVLVTAAWGHLCS